MPMRTTVEFTVTAKDNIQKHVHIECGTDARDTVIVGSAVIAMTSGSEPIKASMHVESVLPSMTSIKISAKGRSCALYNSCPQTSFYISETF